MGGSSGFTVYFPFMYYLIITFTTQKDIEMHVLASVEVNQLISITKRFFRLLAGLDTVVHFRPNMQQ